MLRRGPPAIDGAHPTGQHSALARAQRAGTVAIAVTGLWWCAAHWRDSPVVAVAGLVVIWLGYMVVLALEFVMLWLVGRHDPAPRPTGGELVRAWLAESWLNAVVFAWWQPFRWNAIPDQLPRDALLPPRRGVVFIHGFVCNRGFWVPWLRELRARGIPFAAVNLEPAFGSIDSYGGIIDEAVQRVTRATGLPPVLVCHSMGGVAARAWLRAAGTARPVHHVITIGSPHHGTWSGRFSHARNVRQMRLDADWIRGLSDAAPNAGRIPFTCWYSNCDNIVFPVSTAALEGADNRLVRGPAHVELAFHPRVVAESLAIIGA